MSAGNGARTKHCQPARLLLDVRPALLAFALALGCSPAEEDGPTALQQDDDELREQLEAVGYVGHVEDEQQGERTGVFLHDEALASRGVTVYGSRKDNPEAYMVDMQGNELWRWRLDRRERGSDLLWIQPAADGNLIAVGRRYLLKMDWDSKVLWEAPPGRYHHDFTQDDAGRIYAMALQTRQVQYAGKSFPVADDRLLILTPQGELIRELSMLDLLGAARIPADVRELMIENAEQRTTARDVIGLRFALDHPADFPHLNSVVLLDRDIGVGGAGDLLLSLRSMDLMLILDLEQERIVWEWGPGELDRQHRPLLLENDNILVFDNGWRRGYSRLVELDPRTREIVWQYVADPPESFFSRRAGMAQPLANGNLLVSESDKGHVFEITRAGEIVWSFWNPQFKDNGKRQTIYRAWRWAGNDLAAAAANEELAGKLRALGYLK